MRNLVFLIRNSILLTFGLGMAMNHVRSQSYQINSAEKQIRPVLQGRLGIDSTPFGDITVFDNRLDTNGIFTVEDGNYPPKKIGFDSSAAFAIKECLENLPSRIKRGGMHLVINIRQLRIPNLSMRSRPVTKDERVFGVRLAKTGDTKDYNMHEYLLFTADVFYKAGDDRYRKLFTMHKELVRWGSSLEGSVDYVLRLLLETASISFMNVQGHKLRHDKNLDRELKDRNSYIFDNANKDYTLLETNKNVRTIWSQYPCASKANSNLVAGRYETFEDFRANNVIPSDIKLQSTKHDSLYELDRQINDNLDVSEAWGLCDGSYLYIKITKNCYLKLYRQGPDFCFFVPWSLPDMHALLAEVDPPVTYQYNSGTGNLIVDLGVSAIFAIIEEGERKGTKNKKQQIVLAGLKHDYRYCIIDMDSGDILYSRTPFVSQSTF